MAGNAWVLIPDEDPARFVPVSGNHLVERVVKPRRFDARFPPMLRDVSDFIEAPGCIFRSPRLGWEGVLYATPEDRKRLEDLFLVAEATTLFAVWLQRIACEHEKVYSGEYFATLVPRWHWICAKCKATGTDSIPQETPPLHDMDRFLGILETVDPEGAASMRRVLERVRARRATPSGAPNT
jgi:hypothetical protein